MRSINMGHRRDGVDSGSVMRSRAAGLVAFVFVAACEPSALPQGNYRRVAYFVSNERGRRLPPNAEVGLALPTAIVIRSKSVYEIVQAADMRSKGEYRVDGDSIFFDDRTAAGTVVAALGLIKGDTIRVRMPPLLLLFGGEPGWDMQVTFVKGR